MRRRTRNQAGQAFCYALLSVVGLSAVVGFGRLGDAATRNIAGKSLSEVGAVGLSGPHDGQGTSQATSSSTPHLSSQSSAGVLSTVRRAIGMADQVPGARYLDDASGVRVRLQLPESPAPEGGYKTVMFFPGWLADEGNYHNLPKMLRDEGFATAVMSVPNRFENSIRIILS